MRGFLVGDKVVELMVGSLEGVVGLLYWGNELEG